LGRGGTISWLSHSPDWTPLDIFFSGLWKTSFIVKNMNELCDTILSAAEFVTNEILANTYEKHMLVVLLIMVPILRYTEHIRNFVSSSVWKWIDFSNTIHGSIYI
jgi:hypothetical protein